MMGNLLSRIFKTLRHQEQMILPSNLFEETYLQDFLEGVLEAIQVSSLYRYPHGLQMLDLLFKALYQERKIIKDIIPTRLIWAH